MTRISKKNRVNLFINAVFKFNYEFKRVLAPLWSTQLSVGNHRVETSKNVENKLKIEITQTFNHLPFR